EYPPTPVEIARNDAIFQAQGNRNPFVDHPAYVDAVGHFLPVAPDASNAQPLPPQPEPQTAPSTAPADSHAAPVAS
ncbi:MAG TPA: endonuclease, partial [Oscillatoriaceae cyanobacterium]